MKSKLLLLIPILLFAGCAIALDNVQEQANILDGKNKTENSSNVEKDRKNA